MNSVPENWPDDGTCNLHDAHWTDVFLSVAEIRGDSAERLAAEREAAREIRARGIGEPTYEWLCEQAPSMGLIRLAALLPVIVKRGEAA